MDTRTRRVPVPSRRTPSASALLPPSSRLALYASHLLQLEISFLRRAEGRQ